MLLWRKRHKWPLTLSFLELWDSWSELATTGTRPDDDDINLYGRYDLYGRYTPDQRLAALKRRHGEIG